MDKKNFKKFLRECIEEVLEQSLSPEDPLYVEYHSPMRDEEPFEMHGEKFVYCWAKYPGGKIDVGVYSYSEDLAYSYNAFRSRYNIKEGFKVKVPPAPNIRKSWGDMNPISRIHGQGKQGHKPKYDRQRDKNWKRDLDEENPVEESGWTVAPSKSTENLGKKYLEDAKKIAHKTWGGVYLTRFHSTSKDGKNVFYEILLHSAQGEKHWLVRENDGTWKISVGNGAESRWEPVNENWSDSSWVGGHGVYRKPPNQKESKFLVYSGEIPDEKEEFEIGDERVKFVFGKDPKDPTGKNKLAVFSYKDNKVWNIPHFKWERKITEVDDLSEMTTTGAVQGIQTKNWVDPDPERKRMKSIAAKSVGGKLA